jgi:hypothetical protein
MTPLLGRSMTPVEARGFTSLAQRLAAVTLMQGDLDANYMNVSAKPGIWS